ncbi:MAG: hypothetical protein QXQ39_06795 [Conexivisphaerales archaeon]
MIFTREVFSHAGPSRAGKSYQIYVSSVSRDGRLATPSIDGGGLTLCPLAPSPPLV